MSKTDVFAEPMLKHEDYLRDYIQALNNLDKEGLLPPWDEHLQYDVYSIQGSGCGKHRSIVLTTDDKHFLTVELGFTVIKGKKHIYPVTRSLASSLKPNMEYNGSVQTSFKELISKAIAVMQTFGQYFKYCNNCQDFCNMYLEDIGLKNAKKLTDGDKAAIAVAAIGIGVIVAGLMANRKRN